MSRRLVLFVGRNDWANLCNRIARAITLHSTELVARVVTQSAHPFGYPEDIVLGSAPQRLEEARELAARAEWVVHTGDGHLAGLAAIAKAIGLRAIGHRSKRWAMTHSGTSFRSQPSRYWHVNARCERVFVGCDSMHLVNRHPGARPYLGPFDGPGRRSVHVEGPLRVCHSPTDPVKKGTWRILEDIAPVRHLVALDLVEGVSVDEAVRRRAAADVYIDQWAPSIGGFGVSVVEAMAYGVPTLCSVNHCGSEANRWLPLPPVCALDDSPRGSVGYWITTLHQDRDVLRTYTELASSWSRDVGSSAAVAAYWERELA